MDIFGSLQGYEQARALGGFSQGEAFGFRGGPALGFERRVVGVALSAFTPWQGPDVPVDSLRHAQRRLDSAVVQDAVEVAYIASSPAPPWASTLPTQLENPVPQVARHDFIEGVAPQPTQVLPVCLQHATV